jgi:cyclophilin family peptidyl-prolyl cis-trans isomerase
MNTREIIISTIVLILLLVGFYFLIRTGAKRSNRTSSSEATSTAPTTADLSEVEGLTKGTSGIEGAQENGNLDQNQEKENKMNDTNSTQPPQMQLKEGVDYQAVIKTSKGDVLVDLFEDIAPVTVNNFVHLASIGFYDGTIFHRVMDDFMIQGGDPTGTGTGGPGYAFADEINNKKLVKGSLAMANSGPDTNGSQFFIVTKEATPWLDGLHTNFGQVLSGMEIAEEISKVETGPGDKPVEDITIESVEIIEN